jgi:hypothetical protein
VVDAVVNKKSAENQPAQQKGSFHRSLPPARLDSTAVIEVATLQRKQQLLGSKLRFGERDQTQSTARLTAFFQRA